MAPEPARTVVDMSLPYPRPSSPAASAVMKANRKTGTTPEVRLRSLLHRRGLRYRKNYLVRSGDLAVRVDIVFPRQRLAVFVDGCFWHRCPRHGTTPRTNPDYWLPKLSRNVARDERVTRALETSGWQVLRIWEHIAPEEASAQVVAALAARTSAGLV